MKKLSEFVNTQNIVTGKNVYEGLKLGKQRYIEFNVPEIKDGELNAKNIIGKIRLTHPEHKYYVYRDMYRSGRPHIAPIDDMLFNVGNWWEEGFSDYEDEFVDKFILFSAKTEQEVLKWYIEEYIGVKYPTKNTYQHAFIEDCEKSLKRKGYERYTGKYPIDSLGILYDFATKQDSLESCSMGTIDIKNPDAVIDMLCDYY